MNELKIKSQDMYIIWNKQKNRPATKDESDTIVRSYISGNHIEISSSSITDTFDGTIIERTKQIKLHKQFELRALAGTTSENAALLVFDVSHLLAFAEFINTRENNLKYKPKDMVKLFIKTIVTN